MSQVERSSESPAVCIVRHSYYPDGHVRRDAEALAGAGYDVSVVALRRDGQPRREVLNGVTVHRLPVQHRRGNILRYAWEYGLFLVLAFLQVSMLHARKHFRVVEVDNMPDVLVLSALVPKLTGARVILYIFDNMPELFALTRRVDERHPIVRLLAWLEQASARLADQVVVTQELARRRVEARGVPAAKLAVVLNCPDEGIFRSEPGEHPTTDGDGFVIVTHGALLERYGVQVLLDALPAVAAAVPAVRLRIIGTGEYRAALEARARHNGIQERVEFVDWLPLEQLPTTLRQAQVGYVGILCDLMLTNKLMEYVALRIPVALTRWPTFEHYYPPDSVAYFTPGSVDELVAVLLDIHRQPEQARARAERAWQHYQRYRWTVQREAYLHVYRELLTPAARGATGASTEPPPA